MEKYFKKEGRYSYYEAGEGTPIVVLHGLMGGLSRGLGWLAIEGRTREPPIPCADVPVRRARRMVRGRHPRLFPSSLVGRDSRGAA